MAGSGSTSVVPIQRDALRNGITTSLFGRRAGIDQFGYEVGEQDTRLPIDIVTTTNGTTNTLSVDGLTPANGLNPNGFSLLACTVTSSQAVFMTGAVSGIYKQITQISSSTASTFVRLGANAQIVSSLGSSFNQIVFAGLGHTANLSCVASGTSLGSSLGGGGYWLLVTSFTTAGGMSLSTY